MSIRFKRGVTRRGLRPEVLGAAIDIEPFFMAEGVDLVITSARDDYDGHVKKSGHYRGDAIDVRANSMSTEAQTRVAKKIIRKLGAHFYVLHHGKGKMIHYHVEYRPGFGG